MSSRNISEPEEQFLMDLYNKSTIASKKGDYDAAISSLDECLCNDPQPGLAILAYWNLAVTILMKFNFQERNGEDVSDEEMKWCQRMLICAKRVGGIYDSHLKNHPTYGESNYAIYQQSKNLYNGYTFYGSVYRDNSGLLSQRSMKNVANAYATPLRCIANEEGA
jgi:hypothetical protein